MFTQPKTFYFKMIEGTVDRLVEDATFRRELRTAARGTDPVSGLTHRHYKYPARFSPTFVASIINAFSKPGDLVLDPYMGGGTTVLEAAARSRRAVGCDVNSLAVFVTRVKSTALRAEEIAQIRAWAESVIPQLLYYEEINDESVICQTRTRNLNLPRARALKKLIALALDRMDTLRSNHSRDFVRCALLNTAQWALNGRRKTTPLGEFRVRLGDNIRSMLDGAVQFSSAVSQSGAHTAPVLIHKSAEHVHEQMPFADGAKADLVVTSPPYPGVHVLYHRWQVDGRRETPAPYWIANCLDGQGPAFYNFGGRHQREHHDYFDESLRTLKSIRSVMRRGALIVQMIAFSRPRSQLGHYLENMREAGFVELTLRSKRPIRTWRDVPGRSWHANLQGQTESSREVVLTHVAS